MRYTLNRSDRTITQTLSGVKRVATIPSEQFGQIAYMTWLVEESQLTEEAKESANCLLLQLAFSFWEG